MTCDNPYNQVCIGVKNGEPVYVTETALAQSDVDEIRWSLGILKTFPVRTGLGSGVVNVVANSQQEAIDKYLREKNSKNS
jgi:hypothetical protein